MEPNCRAELQGKIEGQNHVENCGAESYGKFALWNHGAKSSGNLIAKQNCGTESQGEIKRKMHGANNMVELRGGIMG